MRGRTKVGLAAGAAVAVVGAAVVWTVRAGVVVAVHNAGDATVRDVVVRTTAGEYDLGDLVPGATASVVVGARGESSVDVAWTLPTNDRREQEVGPYFEGAPEGASLYRGTVEVRIRDGAATSRSDVGTSLALLSRRADPPTRPAPRR